MPKHVSRVIIFDNFEENPFAIKVLLAYEQPGKLAAVRAQKWRLPGGKCCDAEAVNCMCPETGQETAIREILEETGLQIEIIRRSRVHVNRTTGHESYYYISRIAGGKLRTRLFGRKKIETPAWHSVSVLPEKINPHHKSAIEQAVMQELRLLQHRRLAIPKPNEA